MISGDLGRHRRDERGVDAAGEEGADGDVGEEVHLDGLEEELVERVRKLLLGALELVPEGVELPVALRADLAVLPDRVGGGGELLDALEERAVVGQVAERHVVPEGLEVDFAVDEAGFEDALRLRGEGDVGAARGEEDGLLAHVVAGEEEAAVRGVPDGGAEHAAQVGEAVLALFLVEVEDDLDVGARAEGVALRDELAAEVGAVVDFAVADEEDVALLVRDGLVSVGYAVDAEAPLPEGDDVVGVEAGVIRPPVRHDVRHRPDAIGVSVANKTCNATHGLDSLHRFPTADRSCGTSRRPS